MGCGLEVLMLEVVEGNYGIRLYHEFRQGVRSIR